MSATRLELKSVVQRKLSLVVQKATDPMRPRQRCKIAAMNKESSQLSARLIRNFNESLSMFNEF